VTRSKHQKTRRGPTQHKPAPAHAVGAERQTAARPWLFAAVLAALTLLGFAPSLANDFVAFDDYQFIRYFADFNPPTLGAIGKYWTKPYPDMYTPVLWTAWGLLAFAARSQSPSGDVSCQSKPFGAYSGRPPSPIPRGSVPTSRRGPPRSPHIGR